jgi:hypothetical protein
MKLYWKVAVTYQDYFVRFQVLTVTSMKMTVFWDIAPSIILMMCLYFSRISIYDPHCIWSHTVLQAAAELSARLMLFCFTRYNYCCRDGRLAHALKQFYLFCCCRVRLLIPYPPRFTVLQRTLLKHNKMGCNQIALRTCSLYTSMLIPVLRIVDIK